MAPKTRAKSVPKAKAKAKAEPTAKPKPKPKAKGIASAGARSSASPARGRSPAPLPSPTPEPAPPPEPTPAAEPTLAEGPMPTPEPLAAAPAAASTSGTVEEAPAQRGQRLQDSVPDPWASLSDGAALAKIEEEAWDRTIEPGDTLEDGAAHVIAKDAGQSSFLEGEVLASVAVSLDFSENALQRVTALPALWIRNLLLGSNPLQSLNGLGELFPRLLCIDLSFVDIPSIDGGWAVLAQCQHLRALVAEAASVATFEGMELMPSLASLELLENSVEDLEELETLASRCPSLMRLDLRENPVAAEFGYTQAVRKHLPRLMWHDNQSLKKYVAKTIDKAGYCNLNADVNAVDGLYRNEHCSCLEGNPCLDPATCVDWEHREAVAAEARKRKGLRDDFGEQL